MGTRFVKIASLGMGEGKGGSEEEVVLGREEGGLRTEWGLPCANPKCLLQELQQDLASGYLLFSQVGPCFLPQALCCSPGCHLPPPLLHLLLKRAEPSPGTDTLPQITRG